MCYYNLYAIECCLNFIIFFMVLFFYMFVPSNLHNILVSSDKCLVGGGDEGDVAGDVMIGVGSGTGAGIVVVDEDENEGEDEDVSGAGDWVETRTGDGFMTGVGAKDEDEVKTVVGSGAEDEGDSCILSK